MRINAVAPAVKNLAANILLEPNPQPVPEEAKPLYRNGLPEID